MFDKFLRRNHFKGWSKEDQEIGMLLKDSYKMQYLASFLIYFLVGLPLAEWIAVLIVNERTSSGVITSCIIILGYIIFALYFVHRFQEPIQIFTHLVASTLFFSRYVVKGNAIAKEDFETIKKDNNLLYQSIAQQQCRGKCYSICFELLKCLKKGIIQFTAIKIVGDDEAKNYYTMHVLYVNNDWCFDTYSGRQYPLEEVMKCYQGKIYTIFFYEDVEGKTYEEFMEEHDYELEKWCEENDCEYEL